MPRKRQRTETKDDREESPGPSQVKRKRKVLNYDPVSNTYLIVTIIIQIICPVY